MNLNEHAIQIAQQTSKDRGNCYKALKTLLAKIDNEHIESLSYNSDFSHVTLNGVDFFQDARKHWKQKDVHQPIPAQVVVENKKLSAISVKQDDPSIALAMSMISFTTESTKPVETPEPYYIGDRIHTASGIDGTKYYEGGILVEHAPDSCVDEPTVIDAKSCVSDIESYKAKLISLYLSNGYSQYDAEVSANAQMNAFATKHDPDITGTYEQVSDDSFLFNGKETVLFDEETQEFQM
ncbi:hypothetical protein HXV88_08560 [Aeromonas veronii]|uniref:hypothetical protein n=1 Tax=Aeromonas veronii TaxID=654 RepID=UPI0015D09193|nr:hypothetical protein [Aeromonas veronii]QLH66503.1 hypothetical protein HXV88_08560 [Aeromonas veronii]